MSWLVSGLRFAIADGTRDGLGADSPPLRTTLGIRGPRAMAGPRGSEAGVDEPFVCVSFSSIVLDFF